MSSTTTTSVSSNNSFQLKNWLSNNTSTITPKLVTVTIASFTLVCISCLFSLFLVISLFDDFIKIISPNRLLNRIDWTGFIDKISHQLTNFAEWEKQKRASWAATTTNTTSTAESEYKFNEDRFHDMISAVTTYMNDYVHHRKQQTTKL